MEKAIPQRSQSKVNILGLDYGTSRIGVALSTGSLAEPIATVSTDRFFAELPALINKHAITNIVIGDQTPKEFISKLTTYNLLLTTWDETLSSADARQSLLHTTQTRRRNNEHAVSATIILQSWLDNK